MKPKLITIAFLAALAGVVGCASVAPVKFVGPNGKAAYSMRCSGMGRSMEECYQKAGEVARLVTTSLITRLALLP